MIKPCTGLSPEKTAELAYQAAVGGVDIIKDDELVANPPHCPLIERVKAVMPAIQNADRIKGEKTYLHLTSRTAPTALRKMHSKHLKQVLTALC